MKINDKTTIFAHPFVMAILATICCLLWGSAFPAIKLGYMWFDIAAQATGVKSSILNGVSVFVAILLAALVFKQEKLTSVKLLGSILGFSGIVLVNLTGAGLDFSFRMQGEGMIILSTVCYGISSALIRMYGKDENPVVLSGYQFTLGGLVMIVIGYLTGGRLNVWTGKGITIVVYLAFVSAIAYTVWSLLLHHNNVSKVAVFGCLNPVFGAILSALILKESGQSFGIKEVIALVLISGGICIVQKD